MSSFTTPLVVTPLADGRMWQIVGRFEYCVGSLERPRYVISVPNGFCTDFATIPRALWSIFPPTGQWGKAAVIHDYCYENAIRTRRWADNVFYEAMGVLGVPSVTRWLMWAAVRLFGKGNYEACPVRRAME